jgi:hypothetical protein
MLFYREANPEGFAIFGKAILMKEKPYASKDEEIYSLRLFYEQLCDGGGEKKQVYLFLHRVKKFH